MRIADDDRAAEEATLVEIGESASSRAEGEGAVDRQPKTERIAIAAARNVDVLRMFQ